MSEVSIKVEIAGGIYPLRVKTEDEAGVRKAVDTINRKIAEFERQYAIKDKKDVLVMVMLQLVTELMRKAETADEELSYLKRLLSEVESMLVRHQQQTRDMEE